MRMHIQQVSSESTSSIQEHDLTDLVVPSYTSGSSSVSTPINGDGAGGYFNPRVPPRAIIYAAGADSSTAGGHSNTSSHPAALIPTISPPRYQLSLLSHPGSPPSRASDDRSNNARATQTRTRMRESYPPEARRSPPSPPPPHRAVSNGSAPTVLYNESVNAFDATWHSPSHSQDVAFRSASNPGPRQMPPLSRGMTSLPEYNEVYATRQNQDDEEYEGMNTNGEFEPMTDEQHARITVGQYRLGVGYDEGHSGPAGAEGSGTAGKKISDERRLERLKALEREFGRVKNHGRTISSSSTPGDTKQALKDIETRKSSSKSNIDNIQTQQQGDYKPSSYDDEEDQEGELSEKLTFKQMRIQDKLEKSRIYRELGITKNGNLITQGRKVRMAMRWSQGLFGIVAVISGLGGAFFTNPAKEDKILPQGSVSTWFLYIISLASFLCTFYIFTIQPCVLRRKSKNLEKVDNAGGHHQTMMNNMMPNGIVLPIFSSQHAYNAMNGGKKMKGGPYGKNKMGKKGYMQQFHQQQQPMMVNLVVDPSMLNGGSGNNASKPPSRYDDSGFDEEEQQYGSKVRKSPISANEFELGYDELEEEDHDFDIPNSKVKNKSRTNQALASRMMDTMTIMKLQDKWREARRRMRKLAIIDAVWAFVWCAESLFAIGYGGSCKPGSGNGWCDTYNMALASGVLLCVAFSTSFVFDVLDLRRSRSTPRVSRTV